MGPRWIEKENTGLIEMRRRLSEELTNIPQFPEVVGDRRLIRFLRACQFNMDETVSTYSKMLKWRKANNVDAIRQDIIYGGKDSPLKFPNGKKIIQLAPQIIISANACDKQNQPLALEMYGFSPKEILQNVTKEEYLVFLTYALEFRTIVMEQVSHEREQAYILSHPNEADRSEGYGVIVMDFTIRDLKGVGLTHFGSEGRSLVKAALDLGIPNYPECLGKCHMVNVPFVFSSMWYFVKGLLDEITVAKISLSSSDYMGTLLKDIPFDSIPAILGGGFQQYNEQYSFDLTENGPLHYPDAPPAPATELDATSVKLAEIQIAVDNTACREVSETESPC